MVRPLKFLPRDGTSGGLLPWVIAVMVYLSTLALAAGILIHTSVGDWRRDIARSLTVQVTASDRTTIEREVTAALKVLKDYPGIETARRLTRDDLSQLLEPWLGAGNVDEDLPLPELIDVTLAPGATVELDALRAALESVAPHAAVDDYQQWMGRILDLARTIQAISIGTIVLILLVTVAIVIFATRAGLAVHSDIIEIVHFIGANDSLIAGEYQRRFLSVGLKGGLIGVTAGALTLAGLSRLMVNMEAAFLPRPGFSIPVVIALALLPVAAALVAMATANLTVRRTLARIV